MKKRGLLVLLMLVWTLLAVLPAQAADAFTFAEKKVTVFEGETVQLVQAEGGESVEDGKITYQSSDKKVATVDENGVVTGVKKGSARVTATLKKGKKTWKAQATITVARRVTKVTLSTKGLTVVEAGDPALAETLQADTGLPVILMAAGKTAALSATCTPSDASNRQITFTSTDEGVARVTSDRKLKAIQAGECDLIVASVQNPEVTETWHVLVTTAVTRVTVEADSKRVAAGETLQLRAAVSPENATFPRLQWKSRAPQVASVDQRGLVTGLKKGSATIEAAATDGSGKEGTFYVTVTQPATSLNLKEREITVVAGRKVTLSAQGGPSDTDDKSVSWFSSDEGIATVTRGTVTGVSAGTCEITCVSNSNPMLSAVATVRVIQQVSKITFEPAGGVSLPINTTLPLSWVIEPADATIQAVTFSSSHPKIVEVDENGLLYGRSRGSAVVTAAATDGSGRKGTVRVTVTQPVEGVSIQYRTYHIQLNRSLSVKAIIEPSNANNYQMSWYTGDESIATVRGNKNVGTVYGHAEGTTTVTGVTEDGGFSDSAEIRVGDFNGAVIVEEVRLTDGQLWIALRNVSDFPVETVDLRIDCYDAEGNPMICHRNGYDVQVEARYTGTLYPRERTQGEGFDLSALAFGEVEPATIAVYITGWTDSENYHRNIQSEEDRPMGYWSGNLPF